MFTGFIRRFIGRPSPGDREAWRQKIEPISEQAFELAVRRWEDKTPPDEVVEVEIRSLQDELRFLADELRRDHPRLYRDFSSTVSEALLDFNYALHTPPATSLRLHHHIESSGKQ